MGDPDPGRRGRRRRRPAGAPVRRRLVTGRVLVTGGTGFIGSAVLRALAAEGRCGRGEVRALVRRAPAAAGTGGAAPGGPVPAGGAVPGTEYAEADLTDPRSLRGVCDGVGTVLHCASFIGSDEERCRAVNADGTRALLAEAARAGARTVLVSTTAVYGDGPHRGLTEDEREPAPVSPTSRSRREAEREVLAGGGTVLRPPLMLGPGDVWLVPALARLLCRTPLLPDGGRARLSLVAVDDLARLLAVLARTPGALPPGTVHHAAHPDTVTLRGLAGMLAAVLGVPEPGAGVSCDAYLALLRGTPEGERIGSRRIRLIAEDHWYRSPVWARTGCPAGPGHAVRLREAAPWYRSHLAGDAVTAPA
ncbi:NAD-dependent epimerase/dehydratase family protein [Streptomyces sp. SHP 1-2]|nr:NAD-dependent epimerase/dehydratase family protein [Streptomyces sp. SHP 1-2]